MFQLFFLCLQFFRFFLYFLCRQLGKYNSIRLQRNLRIFRDKGHKILLSFFLVDDKCIVFFLPFRHVFPVGHGKETHLPSGFSQFIYTFFRKCSPRFVQNTVFFQSRQLLFYLFLPLVTVFQSLQQFGSFFFRHDAFCFLLPFSQQAEHFSYAFYQYQLLFQLLVFCRFFLIFMDMNHSPFPECSKKCLIIFVEDQQG